MQLSTTTLTDANLLPFGMTIFPGVGAGPCLAGDCNNFLSLLQKMLQAGVGQGQAESASVSINNSVLNQEARAPFSSAAISSSNYSTSQASPGLGDIPFVTALFQGSQSAGPQTAVPPQVFNLLNNLLETAFSSVSTPVKENDLPAPLSRNAGPLNNLLAQFQGRAGGNQQDGPIGQCGSNAINLLSAALQEIMGGIGYTPKNPTGNVLTEETNAPAPQVPSGLKFSDRADASQTKDLQRSPDALQAILLLALLSSQVFAAPTVRPDGPKETVLGPGSDLAKEETLGIETPLKPLIDKYSQEGQQMDPMEQLCRLAGLIGITDNNQIRQSSGLGPDPSRSDTDETQGQSAQRRLEQAALAALLQLKQALHSRPGQIDKKQGPTKETVSERSTEKNVEAEQAEHHLFQTPSQHPVGRNIRAAVLIEGLEKLINEKVNQENEGSIEIEKKEQLPAKILLLALAAMGMNQPLQTEKVNAPVTGEENLRVIGDVMTPVQVLQQIGYALVQPEMRSVTDTGRTVHASTPQDREKTGEVRTTDPGWLNEGRMAGRGADGSAMNEQIRDDFAVAPGETETALLRQDPERVLGDAKGWQAPLIHDAPLSAGSDSLKYTKVSYAAPLTMEGEDFGASQNGGNRSPQGPQVGMSRGTDETGFGMDKIEAETAGIKRPSGPQLSRDKGEGDSNQLWQGPGNQRVTENVSTGHTDAAGFGDIVADRIARTIEHMARTNHIDLSLRLKIDDNESVILQMKERAGSIVIGIQCEDATLARALENQKETMIKNLETKNLNASISVSSIGEEDQDRQRQWRRGRQEPRGHNWAGRDSRHYPSSSFEAFL